MPIEINSCSTPSCDLPAECLKQLSILESFQLRLKSELANSTFNAFHIRYEVLVTKYPEERRKYHIMPVLVSCTNLEQISSYLIQV